MNKRLQFKYESAASKGMEFILDNNGLKVKVPGRVFYVDAIKSNDSVIIEVIKYGDTETMFHNWLDENELKWQSFL